MRTTSTKDDAAVRRVIADWFDAYVSHDVDRMLSFHSENLVVIPQGADPMYGLDPWKDLLVSALAATDQESIDHRIQDVLVDGNLAWAWYLEWKTARIKATNEIKTNYVKGSQVLRRQTDGNWRIERYQRNVSPVEGDPEAHKLSVIQAIPRRNGSR